MMMTTSLHLKNKHNLILFTKKHRPAPPVQNPGNKMKKTPNVDFEAMLTAMLDDRNKERAANVKQADSVRAAAEARALMFFVVNQKLIQKRMPVIGWAQLERLGRKVFFRSRADHPWCCAYGQGMDARGNNSPCKIASMQPVEMFRDPLTNEVYMATGTVYVCYERGKPHRCLPNKQCRLTRADRRAPGTFLCPVSGSFQGVAFDNSDLFSAPSFDKHADDIRDHLEEVGTIDSLIDERPPLHSVSAAAAANGDSQALGARKKQVTAAARAIGRRQQAVQELAAALAANNKTRFQIEHLQGRVLENSHAQSTDVDALIDCVIEQREVRGALITACQRMEAQIEADVRAACIERQQIKGSLPMDSTVIASIVANHMLAHFMSILEVINFDPERRATTSEIDYLKRLMFALFFNVRRVASPASVSAYMGEEAGLDDDSAPASDDRPSYHHHADANLKKMVLVLFYTLRDGMMGIRIIDSCGRVRTSLMPVLNPETAKTGTETIDDDDTDPYVQQTYVFVPPHPGLRKFLPDWEVTDRIEMPRVLETSSFMRKRRQLETYFTRMLQQQEPAEYCVDRQVSPMRPNLFLGKPSATAAAAPPSPKRKRKQNVHLSTTTTTTTRSEMEMDLF